MGQLQTQSDPVTFYVFLGVRKDWTLESIEAPGMSREGASPPITPACFALLASNHITTGY